MRKNNSILGDVVRPPLQGQAYPLPPPLPRAGDSKYVISSASLSTSGTLVHSMSPPSFCSGEPRQGSAIECPWLYQVVCCVLIPLKFLLLSIFFQLFQMLQLLLNLLLEKEHLLKLKFGSCHL